MSRRLVDVLIPTYRRTASLAVTLAGLASQAFGSFGVVISDQSPPPGVRSSPEVRALFRILRARGRPVRLLAHRRRRGLAEQRSFLLDHARAPYALFLDDDVWLTPDQLGRMVEMLRRQACGFVGAAPIGLSYASDVRPDEQAVELWEGQVVPERVVPGGAQWARHRVHNAANLWHVQHGMRITPGRQRAYKVAWVGGCVLYDVAKLRAAGGFDFWEALPQKHQGEDVLAQLRVMARSGGCAVIPSGAFHLELPTTIPEREVDAPWAVQPEWARAE